MANKYISLQGKFYLSEIKNGVAAEMRYIGNVPEFELEITAGYAFNSANVCSSTSENSFGAGTIPL